MQLKDKKSDLKIMYTSNNAENIFIWLWYLTIVEILPTFTELSVPRSFQKVLYIFEKVIERASR